MFSTPRSPRRPDFAVRPFACTLAAALPGLLAGALALAAPAAAQLTPVLVQDFLPGSYPIGVEPQSLASFGDHVYFAGRDAAHGVELWTSDGSVAGTRRLADLCPGPCASEPAGFTPLGGALVFHAQDAAGGSRLYRLAPGTAPEAFAYFRHPVAVWAALGSRIYFVTRDNHLYSTDGTAAGTESVRDLDVPPCLHTLSCAPPRELKASAGALYFASAGTLYRLSEGGTPQAVAALGGVAFFFTELDAGRVVFRGCVDDGHDCRAWVTDGTAAGTFVLEPQPGGFLTAGIRDPFAFAGRVYFDADRSDLPYHQPISTDGTPAGTRIDPVLPGPEVAVLAATADKLYYVAGERDSGVAALFSLDRGGNKTLLAADSGRFVLVGRLGERIVFRHGRYDGTPYLQNFLLTITDGTAAGTVRLAENRLGYPGGVAHQGRLFFPFGNSVSPGLGTTDGSAAGTQELALGLAFPHDGFARPFRVGKHLIADVFSDPYGHKDVWQVDPETLASQRVGGEGLQVVAAGQDRALLSQDDFYQPSLFGYDGLALVPLPLELPASEPFETPAVAADDRFYLTAALPGRKLWETDGSSTGTRVLIDFPPVPGPCSANCGDSSQIAVSGDHVFFSAEADSGVAGRRLSVWDRAAEETRVLLEPVSPDPAPLALPGGRAVFVQEGPAGQQLWLTGGTAAGTQPFFELPAGYRLSRQVAAGARLFLVLHDAAGDRDSLWVSDLTTAGTLALAVFDRVSELVAAGSNVYFAADGGNGLELGFSNGTLPGTRLHDLRPGLEGSQPSGLFALADRRVVFAATTDAAGHELWISDGSAQNTRRLTDLNPGDAASSPSHFREAGGRIFFQATDGATGRELWAIGLPPVAPTPCRRTGAPCSLPPAP